MLETRGAALCLAGACIPDVHKHHTYLLLLVTIVHDISKKSEQ